MTTEKKQSGYQKLKAENDKLKADIQTLLNGTDEAKKALIESYQAGHDIQEQTAENHQEA